MEYLSQLVIPGKHASSYYGGVWSVPTPGLVSQGDMLKLGAMDPVAVLDSWRPKPVLETAPVGNHMDSCNPFLWMLPWSSLNRGHRSSVWPVVVWHCRLQAARISVRIYKMNPL